MENRVDVGSPLYYRTNNKEKVLIYVTPKTSQTQEYTGYLISIRQIEMPRMPEIRHYLEFENPMNDNVDVNLTKSKEAVLDYAKDLILIGNWNKPEDKKELSWEEMQAKGFGVENRVLLYNRKVESLAREGALARSIITEILYKHRKSIQFEYKRFGDEAHFPGEVIDIEFATMKDLGEVEEIVSEGLCRLKAKGKKNYEENTLPAYNQVFIIAPCSEQGIINVFKDALISMGYSEDNIIVQEVKEPKEETIRDAILANISFCKFIIADITGGKIRSGKRFNPNCVYELGYAHAKNKRIICSVREDMAYSKNRRISYLPFDFSGVKFSFWKEGEEEKIKEEIKQRIDEIHKMFQRESWPES